MRGWVYIVTNPSLEGLVKIGYSSKDPVLRVDEFNNAGLPLPHCLEYDVLVTNPYEVEQAAHKALHLFHHSKEWFRCSVGVAIDAVKGCVQGEIIVETYHGAELEDINEGSENIRDGIVYEDLVVPSLELSRVVGNEPIRRVELTKRLWDYIKQHKLQDPINKRQINADSVLSQVFGKQTATMYELTELLRKHIKVDDHI